MTAADRSPSLALSLPSPTRTTDAHLSTSVVDAVRDRPDPSSSPDLFETLLNHPWFGEEPVERTAENRGLAQDSTDPVEPFSLDASGPLAWWWAPGQTLSFRVQRSDPSWAARINLLPHPLLGCVSQAMAWLKRPLVWRVHHGEVQAVLMGVYRATFSAAHPSGRYEKEDPIEGWRPCELDEALAWWPVLQPGPLHPSRKASNSTILRSIVKPLLARMLARVVDQTSRQVQRSLGVRRLTLWENTRNGDATRTIDAAPFLTQPWACPLSLERTLAHLSQQLPAGGPDDDPVETGWGPLLLGAQRPWENGAWPLVDPLIVRWQHLASELASVLAHRLPMWRWMGPLVQTRGFDALKAMDAWRARGQDHPNADLLLPLAIQEGFRPTAYVWQEGLWTPSIVDRPGVWRYALRGPRTNVRWAAANVDALNVLGTLPEGQRPLLHAALRTVPSATWATAAEALRLNPTSDGWPVRRLQVFLQAIGKPGWRQSQASLAKALFQAQEVHTWALSLDACPFTDPSWTWASLVERFVTVSATVQADWLSPLRMGFVQGFRITPLVTEAQVHQMGRRFKNCLRDSVGDLYMLDMHLGGGAMYQLEAHGCTSLLALEWDDDQGWVTADHKGPANITPIVSHGRMAAHLLEFHRRHVFPLLEGEKERTQARALLQKAQSSTSMGRSQAGAIKNLQALINQAWVERSEQGAPPNQRWQRRWNHFVNFVICWVPDDPFLGTLAYGFLGLVAFVITWPVMMVYSWLF